MRLPLLLLVSLIGVVACESAPEDSATDRAEIVADGVLIGPEGGGVRDGRGVLSVIVPSGALSEQVRISVVRSSSDGAYASSRVRVVVEPPATFARPVTVLYDVSKDERGATSIGAEVFDDLRLAQGAEDFSAPTILTKVVRRGDPMFSTLTLAGSTTSLAGVYGLVEAKKIDCDGTTCSTCCLVATAKLACNTECNFDAGELTVDCLRDSDCGGGLKCCAPTTQRGGGVLRVDDNRLTCKADCGGENNHVCDMNDPNRCSTCEPATKGCTRGFCGHTSKTPTQLICP